MTHIETLMQFLLITGSAVRARPGEPIKQSVHGKFTHGLNGAGAVPVDPGPPPVIMMSAS